MNFGITHLLDLRYVYYLKSEFLEDEELCVFNVVIPPLKMDYKTGELTSEEDIFITALTRDKKTRFIHIPVSNEVWFDISSCFSLSKRGEKYLILKEALFSLSTGMVPQEQGTLNFIAFKKELVKKEIEKIEKDFFKESF